MPDITLLKGDSVGIETDYRDFLPVNMYAVARPMFGAAGYMIQNPGLTKHGDGFGIDRGGVWNRRVETHYRVSGGSLIEVDAKGVSTVLGRITGTNTASMPYSFNTQAIVTDGNYWLYDQTEGLRMVDDADLGHPIDCVWINNYYFFTDGDFIYHTDINDEESIDPLKFATAEFMPDKSLGLGKTSDNKVMVFGRNTIEYFIDSAQANFAFTRISTRSIKSGIVGTHCKVEAGDKWYILGGRKDESIAVHVVGVGTVSQVSSREVDKLISQYTEEELVDVVLETMSKDAYTFLIVHLPNETLQLNITIMSKVGIDQAWTILKSGVDDDEWRAKHGIYSPKVGEWIYGDKLSGNLGILDDKESTQYGEVAEWLLSTPFMNLETFSVDELEIETIPGFTITDDATVAFSVTSNGITYGTEEWMQYGGPSDYNARFIAYQLGYVDDWVGFKFRGASRSRMAFGRAKIEAS